jgi:hypothetical protein
MPGCGLLSAIVAQRDRPCSRRERLVPIAAPRTGLAGGGALVARVFRSLLERNMTDGECRLYALPGLMRVWRFGNPWGGGGASDYTDCGEISRVVYMFGVVKGSVVSSGSKKHATNVIATATSIHQILALSSSEGQSVYTPRRRETAVLRY